MTTAMRRAQTQERGSSIRHMTGGMPQSALKPASVPGDGGGVGHHHHLASGQFMVDGPGGGGGTTIITRRYGRPASPNSLNGNGFDRNRISDATQPQDDIEEDAVMFPQSTHSWLFTEDVSSRPIWFAVGIVALSYGCLILTSINIFEEGGPGNRLNLPFQVTTPVRIAQYLAMIIALIMEEEIPTGLYLLRMISKESLHEKFPRMQFGRFVAAAIVRLLMGYLFLFNTFCVVAQATAVLDIFFDVLALQFLQQLDDIAFNLAKIDVFGGHLKRAALSKCFRAEFEKQPFALRKTMNKFLKGVCILNLALLLAGMGVVNALQNKGVFYANEITVTFGEQIWSEALVKMPSGDVVTRTLLFSYFNGVYRKEAVQNDGSPIYVEQNKFDGNRYETTVGAEIRYCRKEKVWAFTHINIQKNSNANDVECPWLLRSPETSEYNLLDVVGDWQIWTGSLQPHGHFSTVDNECHEEVDCNYNGMCEDGECVCTTGDYYGTRCEHKTPCSLITGGEGGTWAQVDWGDVELKIYQRPVYELWQGVNPAYFQSEVVNPVEDEILLIYTGSRWLGAHFPAAKKANLSRAYWTNYVKEFHAFWDDMYSNRTKFVSDPTTQSSIIGVDFYLLGMQGEEFGTFGQLFPFDGPKGSGFYRCVDNNPPPLEPAFDINYLGVTSNSDGDSINTIVDYEIAKGRMYESDILARDCASPIAGIDLNLTPVRSPKNYTHDSLSLKYSLNKSELTDSNIWNLTTSKIEFCQLVRLVFPATANNTLPRMVIVEDKQNLDDDLNVVPWQRD